MSQHRVIGRNHVKIDAADKVTGRARYADDLALPGMLHAKLLRSTHPHAEIRGIDVTAAREHPGVVAVLTGRDLPIPYGILPVTQDEHALCLDRVRCIGDPVAAVAAVDEETATEALALIRVDYRPLPAVPDMESALQPAEYPLHPGKRGDNLHKAVALEFGDVDAGFRDAHHVREDLFFYGGNTHLALEQHASLADAAPDGRLTLWSSTQTPHYVHRVLARVLEMPAARIRVVATPTGGGFGGKTDPFHHEIVAAKLALVTGRPVKICLTREEVFHCHRGRHPTLIWSRAGVDADGSLRALHVRTLLDGGAYGSYGVASTFYTGALQTVTYPLDTYRFEGARVYTTKAPCGPKRGHGTPQGRFALEVQLDKLAEDLDLDPAEMRLKHVLPANSVTPNRLQVGSIGLHRCLEEVVARSGWRHKHGQLPYGRGVGIACASYLSGAGLPIYWNPMPHSGVVLKLDRGGGVTVFCGSTDVGQGSDTVLALVAAEVLGLPVDHIRVRTSDTDLTPVDLGTYSSRVTVMTGNACLAAAENARRLLAEAAAEKLGVSPRDLVFAEGRVFPAADPDAGLPFAEAVQLAETKHGTLATVGHYTPPPPLGEYKGSGVGPSPAYSYSAAVVEVSVEPDTGRVRPEHVWIAHDVGQAINRLAVEGQVEGSVYMGLGEALFEEMDYRPQHHLVHKGPDLLAYKVPTTLDMCPVETVLVEDPDPNGPFGAKEVGQGPLLPIPPAVANAVYDAVGVRIDCVPITPDRVLEALAARAKGRPPRFGPDAFPEVPWPEPVRVPAPQPALSREGGVD